MKKIILIALLFTSVQECDAQDKEDKPTSHFVVPTIGYSQGYYTGNWAWSVSYFTKKTPEWFDLSSEVGFHVILLKQAAIYISPVAHFEYKRAWIDLLPGYAINAALEKQDRHVLNGDTLWLQKGSPTANNFKPYIGARIGYGWATVGWGFSNDRSWYYTGVKVPIKFH